MNLFTNPQKELNEVLTQLFQSHGHTVMPYKGWLVVDNRPPLIVARLGDERRINGGTMVQLDIEALCGENRLIVESFAGVGGDRRAAIVNGIENFTANSLHVFLGAFWNPKDDQITFETWEIGGAPWRATIGNWGVRASQGQLPQLPEDPFVPLRTLICERPLEGELHWVRFFFSRHAASDTCEVLFDNEPWPEAQEAMSRLAWPTSDSYYSVRCFTILQRLKP